jgi:hypothetical protein
MRARTALWMIGSSKLLFGAHFSLWKLGLTPHKDTGIDPFAGYLAMWLLLFCGLAIAEAVAIASGYCKGDRRVALFASGAWVLQIAVIYYQYWLVNGV